MGGVENHTINLKILDSLSFYCCEPRAAYRTPHHRWIYNTRSQRKRKHFSVYAKEKMFLKVVMVAIVFLTPCCGNLVRLPRERRELYTEEEALIPIALYTSSLQIDKRFSDFTTQKLTEELGIVYHKLSKLSSICKS